MRNELRLDGLDRAILAALGDDARLSNSELARRIGLTPAPCLRRVQRLERSGIIRAYRAVIDPKASGRHFEVLVSVDIKVNDGQTVEQFESALVQLEEVVEARRMFGRPDYLLRVLVSDHEAYEAFSIGKLTRLPAIDRIVSHQTMRLLKH